MRHERRCTGRLIYVLVISTLGWLGVGPCLNAQQEGNVTQVELNTGARIFMSTCSACHGPNGNQVSGVDLKSGHFRHASTDEELARVIQNGIPGTGMPPNNVARGKPYRTNSLYSRHAQLRHQESRARRHRERACHIQRTGWMSELSPGKWQRLVYGA